VISTVVTRKREEIHLLHLADVMRDLDPHSPFAASRSIRSGRRDSISRIEMHDRRAIRVLRGRWANT
jgi:hypothetical protein